MAMNEQACIEAIENTLQGKGFDLSKAPQTKEFIATIVSQVIAEVKKGIVNTTVTGSSATGGPVTGTGTGSIS